MLCADVHRCVPMLTDVYCVAMIMYSYVRMRTTDMHSCVDMHTYLGWFVPKCADANSNILTLADVNRCLPLRIHAQLICTNLYGRARAY